MSLRVWLPLNGNLDNYGLSNISITNNGGVIESNGKIGSAYKFDATSATIQTGLEANPTEFSICSWVKLLTGYSSNFGCHLIGISNDLRICVSKDGQFIRFISNGGTSTACTGSAKTSSQIVTNQWYHIAVTFKDGTIKLYIDGVLDREVTITPSTLVRIEKNHSFHIGTFGTESSKALMNDYRIYDHCLSPKEVKEISKGLVLHYKLSGPGGENLAQATDFNGVERVYTITTSSEIGPQVDVIGIEGGKTYTVSAYIKGTANMNLYTLNSGGNVPFQWVDKDDLDPNEYQLKTITFTMPIGKGITTKIYPCTRYSTTVSTGDWFVIKPYSLKIEEGNKATPWCPHVNDTLYHTLGYDNNIEYDCSGYKYNGTKNGTIECDSDTPRYNSCYKFEDTCAQFIQRESLEFLKSELTFSCWIKQLDYERTSGGSKGLGNQYIMSQGRDYNESNHGTGFNLRSESGVLQLTTGGLGLTSGVKVELGKWYHITGTLKNQIACLYINGDLIKTASGGPAEIDWYNANGFFTVGKMSYGSNNLSVYFPFVGNISDARVYATALSADDIKELYRTSALVTNNGTAMAREFMEE